MLSALILMFLILCSLYSPPFSQACHICSPAIWKQYKFTSWSPPGCCIFYPANLLFCVFSPESWLPLISFSLSLSTCCSLFIIFHLSHSFSPSASPFLSFWILSWGSVSADFSPPQDNTVSVVWQETKSVESKFISLFMSALAGCFIVLEKQEQPGVAWPTCIPWHK